MNYAGMAYSTWQEQPHVNQEWLKTQEASFESEVQEEEGVS